MGNSNNKNKNRPIIQDPHPNSGKNPQYFSRYFYIPYSPRSRSSSLMKYEERTMKHMETIIEDMVSENLSTETLVVT